MPETLDPAPHSSKNVKPQAAYHHGNLRAALIAAARGALETEPPESVTLKSLALRLGVSQPAPYRHFESREALLAAVAAEGFVRFHGALAESVEKVPPEEAIERSCLAYIAFGTGNIGVYRLMFASATLRAAKDPELARASDAAFNFLLEDVARNAPPERAHAIATWLWSSLHGLVMLMAEGLACGTRPESVQPAVVVHEMIRAFQLSVKQPLHLNPA